MVTTQLNSAQLNVLSLMSYIDTEQEQEELQNILLQFYRQKTDRQLLQFQQENHITQKTLDDWANQHERTPYNNPDDNKFVDCAITAGATYIVSNDRHFSELQHYDFPKVDVRTLTEFLNIVRSL